MKRANKILLLLVLMGAFSIDGHTWRNYARYKLGTEALGVAGAYVADASSELAVFYNPAGLAQLKKDISFMWEVSTAFKLLDIFGQINVRLDRFDSIPFFSVHYRWMDIHFGLSTSTLFYSSYDNNRSLNVRTFHLTAAYPIMENLSLGLSLGPIVGFEQTAYGFSFGLTVGALWKIIPELQIGASFHAPFEIEWTQPVGLVSLLESYPALFEIGGVFRINDTLYLYATLDYLAMDGIRYVVNGIDNSPSFGDNLLGRLHPHVGIRFLEILTGAHLSIGLMCDSYYFNGGSINQYLLTAGFRFYGNNTVFSGSIVDGFLLGIFYPDNIREEQINISFSYQFETKESVK